MSISLVGHQNTEIKEDLGKKYVDETSELRGLTKLILTIAPEYFSDVRGIVFKIFFSQKKLGDHAGRCKKLDDAVRFKLKTDFFILLDKEEFEKCNRVEKAKLIIHELHHIGRDKKGLPALRKHNEIEDFCELPKHDLFSERVIEKIRDKLEAPALMESEIRA